MPLAEIKAVVSDMDGVLWRGTSPLPGVAEFFGLLRERGIPFVLATNNSGRHPEDYVEKLATMGVPDMAAWQIVTSGTATADYLKQQYPIGARLYVIGNPGLVRVITESGFTLADTDVEAVVAGIDFDFTYSKARTATYLIRNTGAAFIGTNPDVTYPAPEGLVPGAGSVIGMIQLATGIIPTIIGKPQRAMFDVAVQRLGVPAASTLMIGDRLDTDIAGGHAAGLKTALVLSGVSIREEIEKFQPDYIYADLLALMQAWL
jgi:4-nitrophenyl phosphatase